MLVLFDIAISLHTAVINIWNSLPNSIVVSPTVASFKRKLHSLNFMPWCCAFYVMLFYFIFIFIFIFFIFFIFRAPVRAGLSLPWFSVGTLIALLVFTVSIVVPCCHFMFMYLFVYVPVCVANKLDWIGLDWVNNKLLYVHCRGRNG